MESAPSPILLATPFQETAESLLWESRSVSVLCLWTTWNGPWYVHAGIGHALTRVADWPCPIARSVGEMQAGYSSNRLLVSPL